MELDVLEYGATVDVLAPDRKQSQIVFREVERWIQPSDYRFSRANDGASITRKSNGRRFQVLASGNPGKLHGLQTGFLIIDEATKYAPAQWPDAFAALRSGLPKVPGARMLMIGTRSDEVDDFERMLQGEASYCQLHSADKHLEKPFSVAALRAANPSIPHLRHLLPALKRKARAAKSNPILNQEYRSLHLNLVEPDTDSKRLFSAHTWRAMTVDAPQKKGGIWGLDLGGGGLSASFSTIVNYDWAGTGSVDAIAALPAEIDIRQKEKFDGASYRPMIARKELFMLGRESVDYEELLRIGLEKFGMPRAISGDFYRSDLWRQAMRNCGLKPSIFVPQRVGSITQGQDILDSEYAAEANRLHPLPNLMLSTAIKNAKVETDKTGNLFLVKRVGRSYIDPACAMVIAVGLGFRLYRAGKAQKKTPRLISMRDAA